MRVFVWLAAWFRAAIGLLITRGQRIGPAERFARGVLLVPVFGLFWSLLRLRGLFGRPVQVLALTPDQLRFNCVLPDLIQTYIYLFGVWEPDLVAYIRSRLGVGDVFIDVGANIGFDAMVASTRVGDAGCVVAIEASPVMYSRLLDTLRINGSPTNVRVVNMAVAAKSGELDVYAGPAHNLGLTTTVRRGAMSCIARVEARPLGEMLSGAELAAARFIKIDVEGGEDAVLDGMRALVLQLPDRAEIAVELSPLWWSDRSRTVLEVLGPFRAAGFHVYTIRNNYWPWRYLWPNHVQRPRRLRDDQVLTRPMKRLDVILSRIDAEQL